MARVNRSWKLAAGERRFSTRAARLEHPSDREVRYHPKRDVSTMAKAKVLLSVTRYPANLDAVFDKFVQVLTATKTLKFPILHVGPQDGLSTTFKYQIGKFTMTFAVQDGALKVLYDGGGVRLSAREKDIVRSANQALRSLAAPAPAPGPRPGT